MSQQANKNLVVRYYHEMWNKWNFALVEELLTKDISFRGSLGTETHGRAAFCDYMRRVQGAFPDFHNTIEEMIAERNRACARLTYTGTHRGEIFGVAPTGEKVNYAGRLSFGLRMARLPKAGSSAISRGCLASWGRARCLSSGRRCCLNSVGYFTWSEETASVR